MELKVKFKMVSDDEAVIELTEESLNELTQEIAIRLAKRQPVIRVDEYKSESFPDFEALCPTGTSNEDARDILVDWYVIRGMKSDTAWRLARKYKSPRQLFEMSAIEISRLGQVGPVHTPRILHFQEEMRINGPANILAYQTESDSK